MTTATIADPRVPALANALHLMNRHFGSTHTPADFTEQAAADLARLDAEPRPLCDPFGPSWVPYIGPTEQDEWSADYRASAL